MLLNFFGGMVEFLFCPDCGLCLAYAPLVCRACFEDSERALLYLCIEQGSILYFMR